MRLISEKINDVTYLQIMLDEEDLHNVHCLLGAVKEFIWDGDSPILNVFVLKEYEDDQNLERKRTPKKYLTKDKLCPLRLENQKKLSLKTSKNCAILDDQKSKA